ncbi:MAG: hypothetical protein J7K73_01035 [Nanoarchaeota archaeon]|nr:hypothetical protein [Nanoarchaeota archaeon]
MADIFEMLEYIPKFIDLLLKLALLSVALFFGRIAISGWRTKLDFITKTVGAVLIGFICFAVGILLPFDFLPQIKFVSEMINSLIVAIVLYIILFLLSVKSKPHFLTKRDIEGLREEIDFLKGEVAKINNALIEKGIQPKPPTKAGIKRIVAQTLEKANVKDYKITAVNFEKGMWNVSVISAGKEYVALVDENGVVKEFKKLGFDFSDILTRLKEDKFFLAGAVLAIMFLFSVMSLLTPENLERVSETFSFYGVSITENKCLPPDDLLRMWNEKQNVVSNYSVSLLKMDSSIDKYFGRDVFTSPFLYDNQMVVRSEGVYGAFLVTNESVDSTTKSLIALQKGILSGEGYICSVNLEDNEVCDCMQLNNPLISTQLLEAIKTYSQ